MTNLQFIKKSLIQAENAYIWYKNELESCYKDRVNFLPSDPLAIWYKEHLKEMKAYEEKQLKKYTKEMEYEREGLNPPNMYE